ncbi:Vesicular acetylcholine transporter [Brachionus plicatilis]|uniref:Vesicular acetylcholine transporter n=1 Tax=Brachionus plicatilis TaxID=10195 RepID=A0A3M7Q6N1_BRAPC|nr:Vesicular acetylcholine transporter [Brachionus plicatilis]
MPVVPGINKDLAQIGKEFNDRIREPKRQRNLVLIIVCIALLLDNMLYMVIVPIIPEYLHKMNMAVTDTLRSLTTLSPSNQSLAATTSIPDSASGDTEDIAIGFLFASKAIVQLLVNPFSGAFIDRVGYDLPMFIGLTVIFFSTVTFSFAGSYTMLFLARSLQGVGSAFADTSGLAMIADRFVEENERSRALGIALAFISFGSLVAPPFGGVLYEYLGINVPFIVLAFLALVDGCMLLLVMRPHKMAMDMEQNEYKPKGTPIWKLFQDPYILVCAGALVVANISLAFLEPTIAVWMRNSMNATESQIGSVWLPGFIPHLLGVLFTIWVNKHFPQYQWLLAAGGLALEGASCLIIPFCTNFLTIMIPISGICFGIALVDTAILPTLAYLVDVRHTSVYGSIYAIADISYSLAFAIGPILAGNIIYLFGFTALNVGIFLSNVLYAPVIYFLRSFYEFKPLESNELSAISNGQSRGSGFKKFENEDQEHSQSDEYSAIDTGMSYHNIYPNQSIQINRPESAKFQNMAKYPKKAPKNPFKDTNNLIDNMEEDDY